MKQVYIANIYYLLTIADLLIKQIFIIIFIIQYYNII